MNHVTSLQLCAFLDDVLVGAPDDQAARHLATCPMCRARYDAWSHVDDSLRELLGQDPDEHAMEQRTAWVEMAVTAERKGFPAPEFTELRIPLESRPRPVLSTTLHAATLRSAAPPPAAPPMQPVPPPPHTQFLPPPAPHLPAPEPVATGSIYARARDAKHARATASEPASGTRTQGYARMPRPPGKGLAALASRPGPWIALVLAAALVAALPLAVAKFGVPEIKLALRAPEPRESDVRKAAAGAPTERERDTRPARLGAAPARGAAGRGTRQGSSGTPDPTPRAGAAPAEPTLPPDASILFDLPALEPEDGDPDPVVTPPNRLAPAEGRDAPASAQVPDDDDAADRTSDSPMICGLVRSAQGTPIEGARVYLSVPARMVRTDREGHFCVVCPPGSRTLRIEASGRATVTRTLQLGNEQLETRFTLDPTN